MAIHGYPGSLSRKKLGHHWGQPPTSPTHSPPSSAASVTMATRPSEAASLKVSRTCSACVSRTSHETWMQQGTGNPSFSQLNPVASGSTLGCVSAPKKMKAQSDPKSSKWSLKSSTELLSPQPIYRASVLRWPPPRQHSVTVPEKGLDSPQTLCRGCGFPPKKRSLWEHQFQYPLVI